MTRAENERLRGVFHAALAWEDDSEEPAYIRALLEAIDAAREGEV